MLIYDFFFNFYAYFQSDTLKAVWNVSDNAKKDLESI